MAVLNVYKPLGWTPLEVIQAVRERYPEYRDEVMTYAGRLDPMAEGVLLLLAGEDRFRREEFLGLPKTYQAEFLLGYRTDSGDVLGMPTKGGAVDPSGIGEAARHLQGTHTLPFPVYSSYRVKGKPLHWWAQKGRLQEIDVPNQRMEVHDVADVRVRTMSADAIRGEIVGRIASLRGDFRQKEITAEWQHVLQNSDACVLVSSALDVSSGTYIRALADELGTQLGCSALLFRLLRTRVGEYTSLDAARLRE